MRSNKVEYSTAAGMYCTTNDVNVNFYMPEFSSSKIINHRFDVNNNKGNSGIGYDRIIGRELMIQLGPTDDFKCQVLKWGGATVPMKGPSGLIRKSDLNKRDIRKVVMQTTEPDSTREATER